MHRSVSRRARHRHGFTLLELMVAIAILAVLAVIAIPTYLSAVSHSIVNRDATSLNAFATDSLSIAKSGGSVALPVKSDFTAAKNEMDPLAGGTAWSLLYSTIAKQAPSRTYGAVSIDYVDSNTSVGLAMQTQNGDCVMGLITTSNAVVWNYYNSLGANCDGSVALGGPNQTGVVYSAGPPGPPQSVTAAAGNASASISWVTNSGSAFGVATSYMVTSAPSGLTCSTTTATSCSITGLTPGTSYTFTVVATNSNGSSGSSSPSNAVTPYTIPNAPTNAAIVNTAVAGATSGSITASWVAPANDGWSPITGYRAKVTDVTNSANGGQTCSATTSTSCAMSGLTLGDTYTLTVTATNAAGTSAPSSPSPATLVAAVPTAPTGVAATTGSVLGTANVTWTAPSSNGGSAVTSSTATATDTTNLANGGQTCTTTGSATGCTVPNLTLGDTYTFTVTATNAAGTSAPSSPSSPLKTANVPNAPTGVTATAGALSATVSWTAPYDGGAPITGYTVTSSGGQTCSTTGATSCKVTGLTAGKSYTFTVTATNKVGTGTASTASNAVTPYTVPGAPTSVVGINTTKSGDTSGSATISWVAPANDGSSPITGYTATSSGGQTCSATTSTSCAMTGLTLGSTYTFTVTATNVAGTGAPSSPSPSLTVGAVPTAPSGVTASMSTGTLGTANISWTAPSNNGGSAITGYTASATDTTNLANGGQTCTTTGTIGCSIPNLTLGDTYTFTVTATNASGTSAPSSPSSPLKTASAPNAPTGVTATAGALSATVSWTAPTSTGGAPITGYTVTSSGGQTCTTTGATSCKVTGLTAGTSYTFTVTATNAAGTSTASTASTAVTPYGVPGAPTSVVGINTTKSGDMYGSATISWVAPANNGSSPITGYTAVSNGGQSCTATTSTSCAMTGFTLGSTYTFTVTATNAAGTGAPSSPSPSLTIGAVPTAPSGVTAALNATTYTTADISWTAPSNNGGSTITGYTATATDTTTATNGGQTCTTTGTIGCSIPNLTSGDTYTFTVTATNAFGTSAPSAPSAGLSIVAPPGSPTGLGLG